MAIQSHSAVIASRKNLAAFISPSSWVQSYSNAASPVAMPFTANPSGGVPGYTYSWNFLSGGTGLVITNATSATCTVTASGSDQLRTGTLRCIVNDATGAGVGPTAGIQVTFGTPP